MSYPSPPFATRAILSLAGIFSFRMLGLFIILPIFALYTHQLQHATPALIGLALGSYGLTQAIFQIPLAMWSDRIGRKPIIIGGLCVFAMGSLVAAASHSIYGIILGRALQGAGAVGSTIIALIADITSVEQRTKAMAIVGISIGVSFGLAMVIGPALNAWVGLTGIFALTAFLAVSGIAICVFGVSAPQHSTQHSSTVPLPTLFKSALKNPDLLRLNFGIFALHALFTASFIGIPFLLTQTGIADTHTWLVYLPGLLFAWAIIMPAIRWGEKQQKMLILFFSAILLLLAAQIGFWFLHQSSWQMGLVLALFFLGFTFLETTLPSWVSKIAPEGSKGTAIGIYSTAQFLGIFIGGALGGWIYSWSHLPGLWIFALSLCVIWLWMMQGFSAPAKKLLTRR